MNKNSGDLLIEVGDFLLESLVENELIKEIPVIGTSLRFISAVNSIRDTVYINKVKSFLNQVGEISEEQKQRLISESKKSEKNRIKFGNALYSSIEKSDSQVKIQYIGIAFEAFLNGDIEENDLRMICHIINNTFVDELIEVVENNILNANLKNVVSSGLAVSHFVPKTLQGNSAQPFYELSTAGEKLKSAWKKYNKS
jgi:hypothetical protein